MDLRKEKNNGCGLAYRTLSKRYDDSREHTEGNRNVRKSTYLEMKNCENKIYRRIDLKRNDNSNSKTQGCYRSVYQLNP